MNLGAHRASIMASIDAAFRYADQHRHDQERGQLDLFGMIDTKIRW